MNRSKRNKLRRRRGHKKSAMTAQGPFYFPNGISEHEKARHEEIRGIVEREFFSVHWGQMHRITPRLSSTVFGNGRKPVVIQPLNTRPEFYVVRMDSWTKLEMDVRYSIWELLDEVYMSLGEEFGDANDEGEDNEFPDGRDWPAFNGDCGVTWWETDLEHPWWTKNEWWHRGEKLNKFLADEKQQVAA